MDNNKQIQKVSKLSLEKLSEDSKLVKRGLRDLSIWPKIEELFAKLKAAYENGQIDECMKIAEEILQTDSNHFFTLCYYGRCLYQKGEYEKSLEYLTRCLDEEENYFFLWKFRGDCYYKMKDYKKAINIAQGSPFITLEFSAQKGGNLASSLFVDDAAFDAVAQGGDEDIKLLSLDIISEKQPVMVVKQNAPNPFTDFTVASFTLENDMPVEITIYDQMGKMVYHDYKNYNKGTHILTIDDTQLKGLKGVFLLSVETAEVSEVRKMLRLK